MLPVRAGDTLDQQGHLFIVLVEAALQPVGQGILVHGAGEDAAHRFLEKLVTPLRRALVDAEVALVLAREGVAEGVLQEAAGADDDRRLAEILQHQLKLLLDLLRKGAAEHFGLELPGTLEIPLPGLVGHEGLPPAVLDDVGVEDVGADEIGVVQFQVPRPVEVPVLAEDVSRQEHAHRFAADEARPDEAVLDLQEILQGEEILHEGEHALFPADQDPGELIDQFLSLGQSRFIPGNLARLEKDAVPVIEVPLRVYGTPVGESGEEPGGVDAVHDRDERLFLPDVGQEHGG